MPESLYQLVSMAARPLFLLLAALIVLRGSRILLSQHHERKKLLRRLPDAGMVGEMRDIESDRSYPLPREGVLGSGRGCDIRLKGLRRRQVSFAFVEGKGVLLTPARRRSATWLDGVPLDRPAYALHGALLRVGGYTLNIRLFAGLNVPDAAQLHNHWQPAYEEDFYAPDETGLSPVQTPYGVYWPAQQPVSDEEVPLFDLEPPAPQEEAPPPEPIPAPAETAAPAVRHRRSDRRRSL
ncbi:MAG: FHA domain-containing protein [Clostridia bacterium]|nr:FHA domain-containing protein [Clostridia bacterium]